MELAIVLPAVGIALIITFLAALLAAIGLYRYLGSAAEILRRNRRDAALLARGRRASARVLEVDGNRVETAETLLVRILGGQALATVRLEVFPEDGPSYEVAAPQPFWRIQNARERFGDEIAIAYDPNDPERFVVDPWRPGRPRA